MKFLLIEGGKSEKVKSKNSLLQSEIKHDFSFYKNHPQSLNQLKEKYGFPLTVMCVKEFYTKKGKSKNMLGRVLTYTGIKSTYRLEKGFLYSEEDCHLDKCEDPNVKNFVLFVDESVA